MSIQEILTLLGSVIPLLAAFLTFLIKFIKNEKAKKILSCTLQIAETIQPLIVEAEKFTHFSGEEKKQYVLTKANQFAIDHKIKFDQEKVSSMIDELVATTKKVNMRDKDKARETVGNNLASAGNAAVPTL